MNRTLTTLILGNFKAFAETQRIPIRPLTLIFGANSAGKSSILHGLLYAREAMESGDLNVVSPGLAGNSVDLGGFDQFIHRHKAKAVFTWGADFMLPEGAGLFALETPEARAVGLSVQIGSNPIFGVGCYQIDIAVMGDWLLQLCPRSPVVGHSPRGFSQRGIRSMPSKGFYGRAERFLIQKWNQEHALMQLHFFPKLERLLGRKLSPAERTKVCEVADALTSEITALIEKFLPREAELVYREDYFAASPAETRSSVPQAQTR